MSTHDESSEPSETVTDDEARLSPALSAARRGGHTSQRLFRWVRRIVLVIAAVWLVRGLSGVEFLRVAEDDIASPATPPGKVLLVRSVGRDEGALTVGALYFTHYEWPAGSGQQSLRLVRLVGLPGEDVTIGKRDVLVGDRPLAVPPSEVLGWPKRVPEGRCLVLTDAAHVVDMEALHPDSRTLGPIPVEGLSHRVVAKLPF